MTTKKEPYHISGHLHVTGQSIFVSDDLKPADMLYAKILASPHAHAKILKIDTKKAESIPGVKAVLTWKDIPGKNQIGHPVPDQPLFPVKKVTHVGQPIAIVVAENNKTAEHAISLIEIKYKKLHPVLSIEEAIEKGEIHTPVRKIEHGNIKNGFKKSDFILVGEINAGAQEHLYLETQRCWAIPNDDSEITLYSSTQSTAAVQEVVAHMLGLSSKDITVDVKRLGGAFGGKEGASSISIAALAALACYKTKKPIELKLSRIEDQTWTGKRHPFKGKYKIGFNKNGKVIAYEVELFANDGAYTDLSIAILERAMLHAENAYFIPNIKILGYACRTNLPPNTAFRGFGAPQGIFIIEHAINKIARHLKKDPTTIREINLYQEGEKTPYGQPVYEACHKTLFKKLKQNCHYQKLLDETEKFNQKNQFTKRGISVVPVKFGISFTASFLNQASSLIWIYSDGSVSLSHGGVEMGQEVNTKISQIVANELGINISRIRNESANTKRIANAAPTAASTGSDLNGQAALRAAKILKERLSPIAVQYLNKNFGITANKKHLIFENNKAYDKRYENFKIDFKELTHLAYLKQIDLGAYAFYKTPGVYFDRSSGQGKPFYYFVFGVALVQVEIDILTGKNKLLKVYIVHENAHSINKEIDRGQILGAFTQGFGWSTMEELTYDESGKYLAITPSTYKIPSIRDLSETFEIEMIDCNRKHASVLHSKAIGEPPLIYGEAAYFAIKDAVESINNYKTEADLQMPATPEAIVMAVEKLKIAADERR